MRLFLSKCFSLLMSLLIPAEADAASLITSVRRYSTNAVWLMVERVFVAGLSFWVGIYVIRYLGPSGFGNLSYALSFVGLFSGIAALGLDSIVIRDLVRNEDKNDELLGTAFVLKFQGALFILIVLSVVAVASPGDKTTNWLILFIAFASIFQSLYVVDFYFQSRVLSKYPAWVRCLAAVFSAVSKIVLISLHAPLLWFALAVTAESVVTAVGFLVIYRTYGPGITRWKFKKILALRLLKDSWPLILSGVTISVYMRVDQVMIKNILDAKSVGIYAAAVNLTEVWYFLPTIIIGSLFPAIINAKKMDRKLYLSSLQRLHDLFFLISLAIGVLVFFFSQRIVNVLYGQSFSEAGMVLAIYIWSVIFIAQGHIRGYFLIVENKQHIGLWFRTSIMAANVVLNLFLIPRYGLMGAALAALLSYSLSAYLFCLFHPLLRLDLMMCLESFLFPARLLLRVKGLIWPSRAPS